MRVAILGVGGLGRTLASELRADRRVTSLLLTDQFGERARVLTGIPGRVSIEATQLNVENHAALGRAIKGSDIVVNTTLPRYNLRIMGAALEAGAHYLDIAAAGPSEPGAQPGIFAQLARADDFKAVGRTALVSMGFDPGISNVMARDAAERFEAIDAIRIRAGELVTAPGPGYLPLSSREAFLENVLVRPSALVLPLQGATALTVEVEGVRDGHHLVRRGDVLMSQPDANRRRSTTAVNYLTAVGAAIGVAMIGDQATPGPGVHPPEALDRERVFKEWAARELPMQWSERAVAA